MRIFAKVCTKRVVTFAPVETFRFCTFAVTMFADKTLVVKIFATLTLAMFMTFR